MIRPQAIGGYFGFETDSLKSYHPDALALNSGRNCIEYIVRIRGRKRVYIPDYLCSAISEPLYRLGVDPVPYLVDELLNTANLPAQLPQDTALLYINYFALKNKECEKLAMKYGQRLIVDNSQAFYAKPIKGVDSFCTARKFFPVADGAYLYTENAGLYTGLDTDCSYERMIHILKRADLSAEEGFEDYRRVESLFSSLPLARMSRLTEALLSMQDYEGAAKRRRDNFCLLHDALGADNLMPLSLEDDAVPLAYPFRSADPTMRRRLIANRIFVPAYWPNVLADCPPEGNACRLAQEIIPLPIDQRYGEQAMRRIINAVKR